MVWQIFGTLAAGNQNASLFDTLSGQIAINTIVKCGAAGTNGITLTVDATNGPTVPAYVNQQHYSFIAVGTSSAAVTLNISGLGALKAFAADGTTQLGNGDIVSGCEYVFGYNSALDATAGGFQLISAAGTPTNKLGSFTRVLSDASGNQAITGVGFKPRLVTFQTGIGGGSNWASAGQSDVSSNDCLEFGIIGFFPQGGVAGIQRDTVGGGDYNSFVVASLDSDGFTLTWTKFGSPTATATILYNAYK